MARTVEGKIEEHTMDALVFGDLGDVTPETLQALEARYPGLQETWNMLQSAEGWVSGVIYPAELGGKKVVLVCTHAPQIIPEYSGVRACIQKICSKTREIGARRFAMPVLGKGSGQIVAAAFEVVVGGAESNNVEFDIYA